MNRAFLLAASILLAFAAAARMCGGEKPRGGSRIAVVDVDQLFLRSSYYVGRLRELDDEIEAERKRREEEERRKDSQYFKDLSRRLDLIKKGSPEWRAMEEEFGQCRFTVTMRAPSRREIQHYLDIQAEFFTDLREEVARYAQEEGIDLVLRFRRGDLTPGSHEEIRGDFMHVDRVDITDAIQSRLRVRNAFKNDSPLED